MDEIIKKFVQGLDRLDLRNKIQRIYLFGSRARRDESPDSDYDFLICVSKPDNEFRDKVYDIVVDILIETGKVISLKIFKVEEFDRLCQMQTPFIKNILREGIKIG